MKSISLKRHEIKRNHYMDVREWEVADRYLSVLNPNFSLFISKKKKERKGKREIMEENAILNHNISIK